MFVKYASLQDATHVLVGNTVERIATKWGVSIDGSLSQPEDGGFGVITTSGKRVPMHQSQTYFKEELL